MSSESKQDIAPMISVYKKLFVLLSIVTLLGISIALLHVPLWILIGVGVIFISIKSLIVFESFKKLIVGRNAIIILFSLTLIFLIGLLLLPVLNHNGYIVGTEDLSKQLLMERSSVQQEQHGH